jgi:hypothetical protein
MRACGECSLCCKLLAIADLDKPGGEWCRHCKPTHDGCMIYDRRPEVCRKFACQWLKDASFGDEWFPPKARMFLFVDGSVRPLVLRIVSDVLGRWRKPPYYDRIQWLADCGISGQPLRFDTVAQYGRRFWLILPGKEIELPSGHHSDR